MKGAARPEPGPQSPIATWLCVHCQRFMNYLSCGDREICLEHISQPEVSCGGDIKTTNGGFDETIKSGCYCGSYAQTL